MEIGTFLFIALFSYGLGVLWYDLLPGRLPEQWWRVMAYPFIAIGFGQALVGFYDIGGPVFGGINVVAALIASLVGVIVDWVITEARQPKAMAAEAHPAHT